MYHTRLGILATERITPLPQTVWAVNIPLGNQHMTRFFSIAFLKEIFAFGVVGTIGVSSSTPVSFI
ncbi:MAG: GtrA-like protein [uncultured Paraburkholderia sp.]|nr:MAG: GtrA-like protein [uncultured Paraburkholderia sp.]